MPPEVCALRLTCLPPRALPRPRQDERFSLTNKLYGQYFQLYFQRLMLVSQPLKAAAQQRWPGIPRACLPPPAPCRISRSLGPPRRKLRHNARRKAHRPPAMLRSVAAPFPPRANPDASLPCALAVRKVLELVDGQDCILVGTLYKEMRLKPSILDEYVKDLDLTRSKVVSAAKFNAPDDALVLEDEAARVKLAGPGLPIDTLVSGACARRRHAAHLCAYASSLRRGCCAARSRGRSDVRGVGGVLPAGAAAARAGGHPCCRLRAERACC